MWYGLLIPAVESWHWHLFPEQTRLLSFLTFLLMAYFGYFNLTLCFWAFPLLINSFNIAVSVLHSERIFEVSSLLYF